MIRISKDRKLSIKVLESQYIDHWNFKKNRPKANCPNKDYIIKIIIDKEAEYQKGY